MLDLNMKVTPLPDDFKDKLAGMRGRKRIAWLAYLLNAIQLGVEPRFGGHENTEYLEEMALIDDPDDLIGYNTWLDRQPKSPKVIAIRGPRR